MTLTRPVYAGPFPEPPAQSTSLAYGTQGSYEGWQLPLAAGATGAGGGATVVVVGGNVVVVAGGSVVVGAAVVVVGAIVVGGSSVFGTGWVVDAYGRLSSGRPAAAVVSDAPDPHPASRATVRHVIERSLGTS